MSLKPTLHPPRQLDVRAEASAIFRQFCDLPPPPDWIDLLLEPELNNSISDVIESRIRLLGTAFNTGEPDIDWLLDLIIQNCPELEKSIETRRAILENGLTLWRNDGTIAAHYARQQQAERPPVDPSELPTETQRKQMDRDTWLSMMEPVTIEREFIQNKERVGPTFALAKLTAPFIHYEGAVLRDFTTATSSFLERISWKLLTGKEHLYQDGDYRVLSPFARGLAELIFHLLFARLPPERERVDSDLKWATQQFALIAFEWRDTPAPENVAKRLRALATSDLAGLRSRVREMGSVGFKQANHDWGAGNLVLDQNMRVVLWFGGLADGLGQLLQILRALPFPAVGANLASWGVEAKGLGGWSLVPNYLVNAVHLYAGRLSESEPTLRETREALAEFCLKRIGQRKGERTREKVAAVETLVEPEAHWRACYLYAVDSLRVNPKGKGHETVYWAKNYDPDPMVREIANEVYPRIKRHREIPDGSSPRRPLITAIWWLLQAHRSALGLNVDEESIHATLSALVRRTTESKKPTTQPN